MIFEYQNHIAQRKEQDIPPLLLSTEQMEDLIKHLTLASTPKETRELLLFWLTHYSPTGVDEAAKIKSQFLFEVSTQKCIVDGLSSIEAIKLLGTMRGGYNIPYLTDLLLSPLAEIAMQELKKNILIFDQLEPLQKLMEQENSYARQVIESWANGEWFVNNAPLPEKITLTVFKVDGETTTDDLSPATDAWSRPDIPYHAISMLKNMRSGIFPNENGKTGPLSQIKTLKLKGYPLVYVGDIVGTGSSRKSATNSMIWHFGKDIPFVSNKKVGGFCFGGKISPIFFNTQEDSGSLPIELDVHELSMGDIIDLYPYKGIIKKGEKVVTTFQLKSPILLDEVRAGGRINLIIGRSLTHKCREMLGMPPSNIFRKSISSTPKIGQGYTLAQKLVGLACGLPDEQGILPGSYCEPVVSTVGSQDTTGGMTREEIKDLACLKFQADLVLQSFCHTAPYPNLTDIQLQKTLPEFIASRGGISLSTKDGIIHSWMNRLILPNTIGTGGDSHTRFPFGLSFPGGSGLVAFAASTGIMPLDMPESVLVRFKGQMKKGITLRDLVNAIPFYAKKQGLLTLEKKRKKQYFFRTNTGDRRAPLFETRTGL